MEDKSEMKCLRCSGIMKSNGIEKIQLGKASFWSPDWNNIQAGALEVEIYVCSKCGKMEFYSLNSSDDSDRLPTVTCPKCNAVHDFDYPKCPNCKHQY